MPAVPLNVFITPLAEQGAAEPAGWNRESVEGALQIVNQIWTPADFQFVIRTCVTDKPLDVAKSARGNDRRMLDILSYRRPAGGGVHVFLIHGIPTLNAGGASYLNSDPEAACFVQSYLKKEADGRALAHELGHLLSLDHAKVDRSNERRAAAQMSNLMVEGLTTGTQLTAAQISSAKGSKLAKKFGG